jgi:hypothetical protein
VRADDEAALESAAGLANLIHLRLLSTRPAPQTGPDPTIYSSPDGKSTLIAWLTPTGRELRYVESQGEGWSSMLRLVIGDTLTLADAWAAVERRIQNR